MPPKASFIIIVAYFSCKEVASATLHNAHKDYKRAKTEHSFAHLLFFIFKLLLGFGQCNH